MLQLIISNIYKYTHVAQIQLGIKNRSTKKYILHGITKFKSKQNRLFFLSYTKKEKNNKVNLFS